MRMGKRPHCEGTHQPERQHHPKPYEKVSRSSDPPSSSLPCAEILSRAINSKLPVGLSHTKPPFFVNSQLTGQTNDPVILPSVSRQWHILLFVLDEWRAHHEKVESRWSRRRRAGQEGTHSSHSNMNIVYGQFLSTIISRNISRWAKCLKVEPLGVPDKKCSHQAAVRVDG